MILQKYHENNGIVIFHDDADKDHADYNSQGLDSLYRTEQQHFWFIARKEFILHEMKKTIDASSRIIEIGAGTGSVSRFLNDNGYSDISIGEMHINGLHYAKTYGIKKCYQFDLLRTPFEDEFDTICLFDVLEHITNDEKAISNVNKMLNKNGYIVLTVPAHDWLWNRDDAIAGHKRRYTKKELVDKLESSRFDVLVATYFFKSIVPLLILRRFINKDNHTPIKPEEYETNISINPIINKVLLFLSRVEHKLNKFVPDFFGGSLLIIARKK